MAGIRTSTHDPARRRATGGDGRLERLEVRFVTGGSMASSAHGLARQSNDVDVAADLTPDAAAEFSRELGPGFYADSDTAREGIRAGRCLQCFSA